MADGPGSRTIDRWDKTSYTCVMSNQQVCSRCRRNPAEAGFSECACCRKYAKDHRRQKYLLMMHRARRDGLCKTCLKVKATDHGLCKRCRKQQRAKSRRIKGKLQGYYRDHKDRWVVYSRRYAAKPGNVQRRRKLYREQRYRRVYGISVEELNTMIEQQGNRCAICDNEMIPGKRHLDHDHVSGKVRAVLCMKCNRGLGFFKDSLDLLHKAAAYLEHHHESSATE